ncbi:hypothetical protein VE03_10341 [Pseudogymnoascus sp. 23342-1-I1]|nr:hypothetical protein VE03_10341 [Pseudogymnoascus sp. 23342-1-I1]
MAQTANRLIQAQVQWWNRSSIYIRCPSCEEVHRHSFSGDYTARHRRLSHCANFRDYEIRFPFSEGDTYYEIDKQRALFVAGGADPTEYFLEQEGKQLPAFAQDMRSRHKWTEATETIHYDEKVSRIPGGYSIKRLVLVTSAMIRGKVESVRQYLDDSAESDLFLHGVEAWDIYRPSNDDDTNDSCRPGEENVQTSGKTALHFAACEMYPQVLELLLQRGADPNAADVHGRVPLVEAALWGRLENVQVLLKHGADKELECVRDGRGLRAIDFARSLRANAEERYCRSGSEDQVYKENTYERDQDRKAIVRLLEDEVEKPSQDQRSLGCFAFTKSLEDENLLTLVAHFDIPNKWKTIGVLYRGHQLHSVAAMSGWAHREDPGVNIQIARRSWTAEVRRLCEIIGYDLAPDDYDQGEPGRYHACHAEKQLIAFFVSKHLFLPYEIEDSMVDLNLNELSDEEYEQLKKKRAHRRELSDLKSSEPATSLQKATILVCRPICTDCKRFAEKVNCILGLDITVFHRCLELECRFC